MPDHNFIDHVRICCKSGDGGAGSSHFHRDKFTAKGGPDGGDGGRGGHIILKGNKQLWTLLHLRYRKHIKADNGNNGQGSNRYGAEGDDEILEVPLGTIAKDADTGEEFFEITDDGEERILLKGGRGGLGNSHFKSSINQTPRYAQSGEAGTEKWIVLELKVLADVGLVGLPNAGKSTFLSVVSAAKPEIADYPFTTLTPNLGVVPYREDHSFIIADIPGIIEGAHKGKGLGIRFLRHVERNAVLLLMISSEELDIASTYNTLLNEIRNYGEELYRKKRIICITKADLLDEELKEELRKQIDEDVLFISSVTQEGIQALKDKLWYELNELGAIEK